MSSCAGDKGNHPDPPNQETYSKLANDIKLLNDLISKQRIEIEKLKNKSSSSNIKVEFPPTINLKSDVNENSNTDINFNKDCLSPNTELTEKCLEQQQKYIDDLNNIYSNNLDSINSIARFAINTANQQSETIWRIFQMIAITIGGIVSLFTALGAYFYRKVYVNFMPIKENVASVKVNEKAKTLLKIIPNLIRDNAFSYAMEKINDIISLNPDDALVLSNLYAYRAYLLSKKDNFEGAYQENKRAKEILDGAERENMYINYNYACYACLSGRYEEALEFLSKVLVKIPEWKYTILNYDDYILLDTDFENLKDNDRFKSILGLDKDTEIL
jgi:tetratricopeptide (TPR) repeat protein